MSPELIMVDVSLSTPSGAISQKKSVSLSLSLSLCLVMVMVIMND